MKQRKAGVNCGLINVPTVQWCDKEIEHKAVFKKWDSPIFLYFCISKQDTESLIVMASSHCLIYYTLIIILLTKCLKPQ